MYAKKFVKLFHKAFKKIFHKNDESDPQDITFAKMCQIMRETGLIKNI